MYKRQVFTVELGRRAVRIGVLGLGAMEAPEELPESFVSGVRFAHRDNTSGSYSCLLYTSRCV